MSTPDTAVNALADRFWEDLLRESPTTATVYGDERYDDLLDDPGPAGRAAARALRERTLAEIAALPTDGLAVEERITRDMMQVVCELGIEQADSRMDLLAAVDQMSGPQTLLPQMVQFQRADTPERLDRLLARLEAYGPFMDAYVGLLAEGRATGLTAPRIAVDRTIAQTERLLAIPAAESPIVQSAQLADGDEAGRARLADAVEAHVRPALARYLDALGGDYLAGSREDPGLWSAPNGDALYRLAMRTWTTLDLDPAEVHQVGLDELTEIDAERRAIATGAGFGGDIDAYRRHLQADPANVVATTEALVARAREDIERALAAAPAWFGRLPVATCDVRPVDAFMEKDAPFAYYFPPAVDGSRPGIFYVNTYDLEHRYLSSARHDHLPRGGARSPLPDRARDGAPGPAGIPAPWLAARGRRLRGGLGPLLGAPGRRDGPLPERGRALRDADRAGLAGRPPDRRHGHPRPSPGSRLGRPDAAGRRPDGDRRLDRDRPLHHVARPGSHLQGRPARDRAAPPRARRPRRRPHSTSEPSTTRSSATDRCRSRRSRASFRPG